MSQQNKPDLSQVIAEEFGPNATYVEGLLERFRNNPELVDDSWRSYFSELVGNGAKAVATAPAPAPVPAAPAPAPAPAPAAAPAPAPQTQGEAIPIRGPALKIVENMESSLSVPTATSERRIPVKLLDENRRIINQHLTENDRGKASYTHLIGWALLRALESFPQLNDGYVQVNGAPSRLKRTGINLGVAVDLVKKDGTRSLLVPNIKNANSLSFSEFLTAYDDVVKRAREGKLQIADFQATTISLTNPGTLGTVASVPRLMEGQSVIIATGAIDYPPVLIGLRPGLRRRIKKGRAFLPGQGYREALSGSNTQPDKPGNTQGGECPASDRS